MNLIERIESRRERSEEERLLLDSVARLADDVIAPRAAHHDRTGEFPAGNMAAIRDLGLNAIFVPEAYEGALLPFGTYLECVKLLTRACSSTGIIYATTFHAMKPLIDFGSAEQKARLLPRIARAAFDDMVGWMNERRQSGRAVIDFQGNQFLLADLASEYALCEAWLDYVAGLVEGDSGAGDYAVEASIAKLRASDLAMRMTTEAVQMHGGYGYVKDYRVERLMRDAKITQIWEGTNQVHRQLIGRHFRAR